MNANNMQAWFSFYLIARREIDGEEIPEEESRHVVQDQAVERQVQRCYSGLFLLEMQPQTYMYHSLLVNRRLVYAAGPSQLPWWRSVHPESVWPSGSSRWTGPGASGPARPGEPAPAPVAEDQSESASCRTPRSGCTLAPML